MSAAPAVPSRALPVDFPPGPTVHGYVAYWHDAGVTKAVHDALRSKLQVAEGRDAEPSAGAIDSQSVQGTDTVERDSRGYDAGKKTGGRKRFGVTDTLGLLLTVMVCAASVADRQGGQRSLLSLYLDHVGRTRRARHLFADGGFAGQLVDWAYRLLRITVEVVCKPAGQRGFTVIPAGGWWSRRLAHRPPSADPRLRAGHHPLSSDDLLGHDWHYGPPHRPRPPGHPPRPLTKTA